ncbi:hypothetical protein K469DRAFT_743634 [Zopfia rhizophila CBS 207.26]|uniref:Homeobox domain-containing protein n=1 Tax=Zopfia rhizophila CBS 207.26 TaxID=1314779 RepID=A0A6A6EYD4_9PEZI|nr:hypothetical protein K469DRAFT_743634 [Zopfia rhizophila CBS 207.26]
MATQSEESGGLPADFNLALADFSLLFGDNDLIALPQYNNLVDTDGMMDWEPPDTRPQNTSSDFTSDFIATAMSLPSDANTFRLNPSSSTGFPNPIQEPFPPSDGSLQQNSGSCAQATESTSALFDEFLDPSHLYPDMQTNAVRPNVPTQSPTLKDHIDTGGTKHGQQATHKRRSQPRITPENKRILEKYFVSNIYPTSSDIEVIAHQTQLEPRRIRNWFSNVRARKMSPIREQSTQAISTQRQPRLVNKLSHESLERISSESESTQKRPLDVYLASSVQDDPAAVSAIEAAAKRYSTDFSDSSSVSKSGRPRSVITSQGSSTSSATTAYTISSLGSKASSFAGGRRRGRRRMPWRSPTFNALPFNNPAAFASRYFFCTFCPKYFKTKYEWNRHENSMHVRQSRWVCCSEETDSFSRCLFCNYSHPSKEHMKSHKYLACKSLPKESRTFYRRDHFIQHLKNVHFNSKEKELAQNIRAMQLADKWHRMPPSIQNDDPVLHCGFCGEWQQDWTARSLHIANHFVLEGLDMSAWWPQRLERGMVDLCNDYIGPCRCRYCHRWFKNREHANLHVHCRVWSCRFLTSFRHMVTQTSSHGWDATTREVAKCQLCAIEDAHDSHGLHHRYRECAQKIYASEDDFRKHLHQFHGSKHPNNLGSPALESYFKLVPATFEPVDSVLDDLFGAQDDWFEGEDNLVEVRLDQVAQGQYPKHDPTPAFEASVGWEKQITYNGISIGMVPSAMPTDKSNNDTTRPNIPTPRVTKSFRTQLSRSLDRNSRSAFPNTSSDVEKNPPRFFRSIFSSTLLRLHYLPMGKPPYQVDSSCVEELSHGHIGALVMSSALIGLATSRQQAGLERDGGTGLVDFWLDK